MRSINLKNCLRSTANPLKRLTIFAQQVRMIFLRQGLLREGNQMTTKSIQQRAEEWCLEHEDHSSYVAGSQYAKPSIQVAKDLSIEAYTAGATDERSELGSFALEIVEALEAYDFGAGTIGHDKLAKHAELIARLRGELK
jgi:hypothetical protein